MKSAPRLDWPISSATTNVLFLLEGDYRPTQIIDLGTGHLQRLSYNDDGAKLLAAVPIVSGPTAEIGARFAPRPESGVLLTCSPSFP
jgi:hypothetical protein